MTDIWPPLRRVRKIIAMDPGLVKAIKGYQTSAQIVSEAEAVRNLIRMALADLAKQQQPKR